MSRAVISGRLQQALARLQAGDAAVARREFEGVVAELPAEPGAWLGLAVSCASLGDEDAAAVAIDRVLKLEPANLRALLFKVDQLVRLKTPRRALRFCERALGVAQDGGARVPVDLQPALQRAAQLTARYTAEYAACLEDGLRQRGLRDRRASRRFERSLAISLGRDRIYYQQPSRFYFPELPQRQFYERAEFPWLAGVEAAAAEVREELEAVLAEAGSFTPYLRSGDNASDNDAAAAAIIDNPDWGAYYLWEYGRLVEAHAARCPASVQALAKAPLPHVRGQTPVALFSRLAPHTRIPPHHGMLNTRLICHLALIVPEHCGALRCGSETRGWVEGETLIFDDSIEHEAWNDSAAERVVLLFDIWRPELGAEERELLSAVLEIARDYQEREH